MATETEGRHDLEDFHGSAAGDNQLATGTYADGFYHVLAKRDLVHERDRNFRESYGRDYSIGRELDTAPHVLA